MVKHTQTIRRQLPTNSPSVFDHFVGLALKGLNVVSASFLLVCFLSLKESSCEKRKKIVYFTSIALFVFEIIKF